jgi:isoleucyl-tRNA synthetase
VKKSYPTTNPNPNFPEIEEKILQYWKERNVFQKSIDQKDESNQFNFYDGPPFANGLPHYGHLLTGFIKDTYARFQTTLGKKVERRFGWDCHGLPAEMEAEKELKLSGCLSIKEHGIEKFNNHCRVSVLKYTQQWEKYVNRQGRWVDFQNSYKTMDLNFMESVMWGFKELYKKGYVYHDVKVMPYSWACQTPLSNFETKLDNSYRERADKAVTVAFQCKKVPSFLKQDPRVLRCFLCAWTTTPWTLVSNLAIAINKNIKYAVFLKNSDCYILAESAIAKYKSEFNEAVKIATVSGMDLAGIVYFPLFEYFKEQKNAFKVLIGDFVTDKDGTGIVHIAPAFGEEDQILCKAHDIHPVCPIDEGAIFTTSVSDFAGMHIFDANDLIIKRLKLDHKWIKTEQYIHEYPHCWRTDKPLIYKAVPSWYVKVSAFKDKMVELNKQINWTPGYVKDNLFGKWLEGAKDWAISRNRFWGTPIPIWVSDNPLYPRIDVYGSIKELEEDFGVKITDLHRPFIDELVRPNPDDPSGKSLMKRVPEVFDCWFESGSMPYAQVHYPFASKELFENHFPADFITEYTAQTRGWFYTLMVLSTALFEKPPFLNCICHGVALDASGQKLSKRLQNYPDPFEIFNKYGADALRFTMLSSRVVNGGELLLDKEGVMIYDTLRLHIKPIWQAYHFFSMYANADKVTAKICFKYRNFLDIYIISQLKISIDRIKTALQAFDTQAAYQEVGNFFEALNNWYIRRSRERFWKSQASKDKEDAYNTLFTCLVSMVKASSCLVPLISEEIYLGLLNNCGKESVHLEDFPVLDEVKIDSELLGNMSKVRSICNAALFIRNKINIKIKQPLKTLTIAIEDEKSIEKFINLIKDEANVKQVVFTKNYSKFSKKTLSLNLPQIAKRIPEKVKSLIESVKNLDWNIEGEKARVGNHILENSEYELITESTAGDSVKIIPNLNCIVCLDTKIDKKLKNEGVARDFVRFVQQARKDSGLDIAARINLSVNCTNEETYKGLLAHSSFIEKQTLSKMNFTQDALHNSKHAQIDQAEIFFTINTISI